MQDANTIELALQIEGYTAHTMAGTWLLVVSTVYIVWERKVWLNGQLYRYTYTRAGFELEAAAAAGDRSLFLAVYIPAPEWAGHVAPPVLRRCAIDLLRRS